MSALAWRFLLLLPSLVLALPPCWCCMVAAPLKQDAPAQPQKTCCHSQRPDSPKPPSERSPFPKSCCPPSLSTTAPSVKSYQPESMVPVAPPDSDVGSPTPAITPEVARHFSFDSPPLQLLHCVWLC